MEFVCGPDRSFLPAGRAPSESGGAPDATGDLPLVTPKCRLSGTEAVARPSKELVNGGTPFVLLSRRQGPNAAHSLNWFKWDVTHRGQATKKGMPNAALGGKRGPLSKNSPSQVHPLAF